MLQFYDTDAIEYYVYFVSSVYDLMYIYYIHVILFQILPTRRMERGKDRITTLVLISLTGLTR